MSISRDIHLITAEAFPNRQEKTLMNCLIQVHSAYLQRGFRVTHVHGGLKFECPRGAIATDMGATPNIASEDEHVPEVERCIHTVNERTRCTYQSTGFERYPPKLIVEMVFLSVFWLNTFPHKHGVSPTISSRNIVTGKHIDYKTHCKVEYGQYVQTHEISDSDADADSNNDNKDSDDNSNDDADSSDYSNDSSDYSSDDSNDDEDTAPLPRFQRNRGLNYAHLKGREGDRSLPTVTRPEEFGASRVSNHETFLILENVVLTQYNLKQGIKRFGDKGKTTVRDELRQLHNLDVMEPIDSSSLTPAERRGALRYLMFLKEKRCGKIKGRGCADGRPQWDYISKEDTSSPTVVTEALILSCLIDAIKKLDVATCDIPGAFMQSDMEGDVVMKLEGVMSEVILNTRNTRF
jgi:hypothetical protein